MNKGDALNEVYYSQLKHIMTAYRNTTPIQILEHLNTRWCPLDVCAKKQLKAEFHVDLDISKMHITAFGLKLDKEQKRLKLHGIFISNEDKIQFYMEQIYALNMFDKKETVHWENKPILITSLKQGYKSTNMAADVGNKLRRYIQEIASAAAAGKESVANISKETKAKDAHICMMTAQIKTLADAIAALTKSVANKENVPPNTGNANSGTTNRMFNWTIW
jgi:hypothetical protein